MILLHRSVYDFLNPAEPPIKSELAWTDVAGRVLLPFDEVGFAYPLDQPGIDVLIAGRILRFIEPMWMEIEPRDNFKRQGFTTIQVRRGDSVVRWPRNPHLQHHLTEFFTSYNRKVIRQYRPTLDGLEFST